MKNYYSSNFKLGVLGGGQLGRMLLTETKKFDIFTSVLENNRDSPCAKTANEFILGDWKNFDDVYNFGKKIDVLTIEIEHVNIDALLQLEKEGVIVYPQPNILKIIQNKGLQKDFYVKNNIPTAKYKRFKNKEELLQNDFIFPFIWKAETLGYDGTGVKKITSFKELHSLPDIACIIEEAIPFKKELAVIVARNPSNEIKTFPTIEMEFNKITNQVEYVICPANILDDIEQKAQNIALQVANAFKNVGLLAVELFLTEKNEILVNEVAPRPHNSGHFSIEASYTNQFEQHIRAILNLPLGCTKSKLPAVMLNLVGAKNSNGNVVYKNMIEIFGIKGVTPHIYGKKIVKPFRKMGHITVIDSSIKKAKETAKFVKSKIKVCSE